MKKKLGRKPLDSQTRNINVTIRFSEDEIKEFEELAKELEIPKTRLIRNLTLSGLEDAKLLNKMGALKGVKKLIDFKERFLYPEKYQTLKT